MRLILPVLLLSGVSAFAAGNLLQNSSFEAPVVSARTPKDQGGDPGNEPKRAWTGLDFQQNGKSIVAGLTNEEHHTGNQALFVQFDHVAQAYQAGMLNSNFIPVLSGTDYEVGIWGKIDPKNPITGKGRSVYLKLEVDYFAKDANESVGETEYAVQPLPGSKNRPAFFTTDGWKLFSMKITTPPDAVFAQVTWRLETGSDPGVADGTIFLDDAGFFGPPAPNPNLEPEPIPDVAPEMTGTDEGMKATGTAATTGTAAQ